MSASLGELKNTASRLPLAERAELAQFLLDSLDVADEGAATDWLALAERRMAEIQANSVNGIPAAQVLESMRRRSPSSAPPGRDACVACR